MKTSEKWRKPLFRQPKSDPGAFGPGSALLFGRPRGGPQGRPSAAKRRRPPPPLGKGGSGRRLRPRGMGWETLRVHGSLECGQERVCVQRGVV